MIYDSISLSNLWVKKVSSGKGYLRVSVIMEKFGRGKADVGRGWLIKSSTIRECVVNLCSTLSSFSYANLDG